MLTQSLIYLNKTVSKIVYLIVVILISFIDSRAGKVIVSLIEGEALPLGSQGGFRIDEPFQRRQCGDLLRVQEQILETAIRLLDSYPRGITPRKDARRGKVLVRLKLYVRKDLQISAGLL